MRFWVALYGTKESNFVMHIQFVGFKTPLRAISEAAANPITPKKEDGQEPPTENWKIKMLYDGDCPLCMREVYH